MADGALDPLRVVVVEDEERARRTLRGLLAGDPDVELLAEAAGAEAPAAIREHDPDIVFLDVQMPGLDGFGVLERLEPDPLPVIVFVTAYDEHALEAFEVAAVDYLLKPFSDRRFHAALERAKREARTRRSGGGEPGRSALRRLILRDSGRAFLLAPEDVDWIQADGVYARVHAAEREILIRESLTSLADRLPSTFFRIHRSALVNLEKVVELRHRSHGDYEVVLKDGTRLTLARTRKDELDARLGGLIG